VVKDENMNNPILIGVSIRNYGSMSSIIDHYSLTVGVNGHNYDGHGVMIGDQMKFGGDHGEVKIISKSEALYDKTINPLAVGAIVRGYLLFTLPQLEEGSIKAQQIKLTLKFQDVVGHNYEADLQTSLEKYTPAYIPGL
jgi:hypothetical protein